MPSLQPGNIRLNAVLFEYVIVLHWVRLNLEYCDHWCIYNSQGSETKIRWNANTRPFWWRKRDIIEKFFFVWLTDENE